MEILNINGEAVKAIFNLKKHKQMIVISDLSSEIYLINQIYPNSHVIKKFIKY